MRYLLLAALLFTTAVHGVSAQIVGSITGGGQLAPGQQTIICCSVQNGFGVFYSRAGDGPWTPWQWYDPGSWGWTFWIGNHCFAVDAPRDYCPGHYDYRILDPNSGNELAAASVSWPAAYAPAASLSFDLRADGVFYWIDVTANAPVWLEKWNGQSWGTAGPATSWISGNTQRWMYPTPSTCAGSEQFRAWVAGCPDATLIPAITVHWPDQPGCPAPKLASKANLGDCDPNRSFGTGMANHGAFWKLWVPSADGTTGQLVPLSNDPASPYHLDPARKIVPVAHGWRASPDEPWVAPLVSRLSTDRTRFGPLPSSSTLADVQIIVADATELMRGGIPEAGCPCGIPNLSSAPCYTLCYGVSLLEARDNVARAEADLAADLRCFTVPGQRLHIPLMIGHSFGGGMMARLVADLYSRADIGTVVTVDSPFGDPYYISLLQNEPAYACLATRWVNIYSGNRAVGGTGMPIDPGQCGGVMNIDASRRGTCQLTGTAFLDHTCLITDLPSWLFTDEARDLTRTIRPAPGDQREFTAFDSSWALIPSSALPSYGSQPFVIEQQVLGAAYSGQFVPLTEQVRAFTNATIPQQPGQINLQAPDTARAGFGYGDLPLPPDAGFVTFQYQSSGLGGDIPGDSGQIASAWLNDRLLWTTQTNTGSSWSTAIVAVSSSAGSTARFAFAVSRRLSDGTGATVNIRDVRLVPVSVVSAPCRANFNGINGLTVQDVFDYLNAWFAGSSSADFDGVNGIQIADIFVFLNAWFEGC